MAGYVIRRLLVALPTLLLVAAAVFFLMRLVPGDPATLILGDAELEKQTVVLKDLRTSAQEEIPLAEVAARLATMLTC